MIHPQHFLKEIIRPALADLNLPCGAAAATLLLGTALVESRLTYLRQFNGGPALGLYQMEPATFNDICQNYLKYRPELKKQLGVLKSARLIYDLKFATWMARIHYYRQPEPLPAAHDLNGQAAYWKQHYNTPLGKGTISKYLKAQTILENST